MKSGIYKITNIITFDFYIGSAVYIKNRWANHRCLFRANKHANLYFQNTWNKYGEENFKFEVLEYCEKEKLIEREQHWLNYLKPKYNIVLTAQNMLGFKHTKEAKDKMRKPKSKTHKQNISHARIGMKFDDQHKSKISSSKLGKKINSEPSAKARLGKKRGSYNERKYPIGEIIKWPIP